MIDKKGYPEFGLEKALSTPYYPNILDRYESSKLWYGELIFKSKQGFLSICKEGQPKFFLYGCRTLPIDLGNIAHKIKQMKLPPYTIFEAELINYDLKKLTITDILLYDNKMITKISIERKKLLTKLVNLPTNKLVGMLGSKIVKKCYF